MTGYIQPIFDDEINTFKDFAILCTRNFGAMIHMRDDPLSEEFKLPELNNSYYVDSVKRAEETIRKYTEMSDEMIYLNYKKSVLESISSYQDSYDKAVRYHRVISNILDDVLKWEPPTGEHFEFKEFMINQLKQGLKYDCDFVYYEKRIKELKTELENFDVVKARKDNIEYSKKDIEYYTKKMEESTNRVFESRKWLKVILNSFKQ